MVKIVDYALRVKDGKSFVALKLQGDMMVAVSEATGRPYLTAKTASMTTTFSEEQVKGLIGQELPGRIVRKECDPFDYTVPETGEVIQMTHQWVYQPEEGATLRAIHAEAA